MKSKTKIGSALFVLLGVLLVTAAMADGRAGAPPAAWAGDLQSLPAADWNNERAAHLLERAGFGGTPEEILSDNEFLKQHNLVHVHVHRHLHTVHAHPH